MKTKNHSKAKFLILGLFVLTSLSSCEKADPELPLADQVMGEYVATSYKAGSTTLNLPATSSSTGLTISATISSIKISENVANFTLDLAQTIAGKTTNDLASKSNVELSKNANGEIEGIYKGGKDILWKDGQLTFILPNADPSQVVTIFASKK